MLVRTVSPTVPPKVEYVATDMARELYDHLLDPTDWAERQRPTIARAREAHNPDPRHRS
ncbi:winged helix-turn-helix transcriptional regulator [Nocardia sp. NPDC052001]|uniref:winged helix-turn-helix transcriptional regulator n=1 Tax=Nocardia sp. NPDC052001 TaxID=3154853 RepID=UPI00342900D2